MKSLVMIMVGLLVGCGTTQQAVLVPVEPVAESTAKTLSDGGQKETTKYTAIWHKWQRAIVHFNAILQKLTETADILKLRASSRSTIWKIFLILFSTLG